MNILKDAQKKRAINGVIARLPLTQTPRKEEVDIMIRKLSPPVNYGAWLALILACFAIGLMADPIADTIASWLERW